MLYVVSFRPLRSRRTFRATVKAASRGKAIDTARAWEGWGKGLFKARPR